MLTGSDGEVAFLRQECHDRVRVAQRFLHVLVGEDASVTQAPRSLAALRHRLFAHVFGQPEAKPKHPPRRVRCVIRGIVCAPGEQLSVAAARSATL